MMELTELTQRAIADGRLQLITSGKTEKIRYVAVNVAEKWSDPEEKVRAAYYAELIYRYGYAPECIGVEVTEPARLYASRSRRPGGLPRRRAYAALCRHRVQARCRDRHRVQAGHRAGLRQRPCTQVSRRCVGVIAGQTRAFYDCSDRFGVLEREANIIADLPAQYGNPEDYKYDDKAPGKPDIGAVTRDDLIKTIRKCHQTLWGGGRLSPPMAFGELTKLIFLKTRDEKTPHKKGEPYAFQVRPSKRQASGRAHQGPLRHRVRQELTSSTKTSRSTTSRSSVVLHLESVNLTATDLDTKGVAFEQFMDGFFKGDFGQYFTPRATSLPSLSRCWTSRPTTT